MAIEDQVIARLKASVPALRTVEGAMSLAALMQTNALPQAEVGGHVITLGLQGAQADAAAGAYTQIITETIGVVITWRSYSQTGGRDQASVGALIRAVMDALVGWSPNDEIGSFEFRRGAPTTVTKGTIVYLLEFSITDQLRILT